MKPKTLLTIAVILLFVAFLAWTTLSAQKVTCKVCVEFNGQKNCASASHENEAGGGPVGPDDGVRPGHARDERDHRLRQPPAGVAEMPDQVGATHCGLYELAHLPRAGHHATTATGLIGNRAFSSVEPRTASRGPDRARFLPTCLAVRWCRLAVPDAEGSSARNESDRRGTEDGSQGRGPPGPRADRARHDGRARQEARTLVPERTAGGTRRDRSRGRT